MDETGESLGKATLDLEANLGTFVRNMESGRGEAGRMENALDAVAAISNIANEALNKVKMSPGQGAETAGVAETMERSVGRVNRTALDAADHLEQVKLTAAQAAETEAAGTVIDEKLKDITGNANEARRALDRVKLRLAAIGGASGLAGKGPGYGVGPFGAGYGRVGLFGSAVGAGVLTAPAAGPALVGLLGSIPVLAAAGTGALGTLALAFEGVGKAIGGDLKAFKALEPAQQKFVLMFRSLSGWFDQLKQTAGESLFPGLTEGLKSALSPGTVGAITDAVKEFGAALGQAGATWGKYFGSPEFQSLFVPLMHAGAHELTIMAAAALSLFDALGVLGRAAIPLTEWMTKSIANGSRFVDAWLRAKDASGALGHSMDEAKSSLQLVGGLLVAIGRAVGALGEALYPVSKIAVKDLTDGLNALAGIITRNQGVIRTLVTTALAGLVLGVKLAVGGLKLLTQGMELVIGKKAEIVTAIVAIGIALTVALGPEAAAVTGVILAAGLISKYWKAMAVGLATTFGRIVALIGSALALIPKWFNPTLHNLGTQMEQWGSNLGARVGENIGYGLASGLQENLKKVSEALDQWDAGHRKQALNTLAAQGFTTDLLTGKQIPRASAAPTPGLSDLTAGGDPFGTSPPFTKNVPKGKKPPRPPVIPPLASHAEALARANASKASVLGNVGKTAKRYLELELANLNTADKAIKEKLTTATGKVRTELFAAVTSVENKMRTVRQQIRKAIADNRADELALAVEVAKNAVASAKEGTAAYDKAVAAEAKALKAEIAYLDARGKNQKLSFDERKRAIKSEIADKKELAALLKQDKAASAGANESQFLSAFAQIVKAYAPNAFPQGKPAGTKTDTHLYDLVNETRQSNQHLRDIKRQTSSPSSAQLVGSAMAVLG